MKAARKIVAFGGGSSTYGGKRSQARAVLDLTGRECPNVLYIPTASKDRAESVRSFYAGWGKLNCRIDMLLCMTGTPGPEEIRRKCRWADAIVIGGGNTLMMMRRWARLGLDKELAAAYQRGVVMSGGSAGSICWFEQGHSDSMRGYGHDPWDYIAVSGYGWLKGLHCPHYHHKDRLVKFHQMMRQRGGNGLAIDDFAALIVVGDQYRFLHSKPGAGAYAVFRRKGKVHSVPLPAEKQFRPIKQLYAAMAGKSLPQDSGAKK